MSDTPIKETLDSVVTESQAPVEEPAEVKAPETTQEEVFAEKGELKGKTAEEMEQIHKNWQRAYTEKRHKETQELKAVREELAALKRVQAETPKNEQVPQIRQEMGQAKQDLELGKMTVDEYTQYMRQLMTEEARQIARDEFQSLSSAEKEQQYQDVAFSEFVSADSRLDSNSPTADEALIKVVQDHLAVELEQWIQEKGTAKGFPATKLSKEKTAEYDARLDDIIKNRTKQSTQMAQARAAKAAKASLRGSDASSAPISGSSIRDILTDAVDQSEG